MEVTLQHGQLQGQDYLTGTSGNSSRAEKEKVATLLVAVTGVRLTTGRAHKLHLQHRSHRDTFPSRGYNFADQFFG